MCWICMYMLCHIGFGSYLSLYSVIAFFFFFKQKTAYEMRISDWSSDVCSSDLATHARAQHLGDADRQPRDQRAADGDAGLPPHLRSLRRRHARRPLQE